MFNSDERSMLEKGADRIRQKIKYMDKNEDFQNKMLKRGVNARACLEKCLNNLEQNMR